MGKLTFEELREANLSRGQRWHKGGLDEWSVAQWAVAAAGEMGEICNAVKKLDRIEDGIANISEPNRQLSTREEAVRAIGAEIADTVIYLDLLSQRLGLDMAAEVSKKFNKVSLTYDFPERL
ncbi:MAG: hypothetical protein WBQ86_09530 [Candidatus Binatus sp.]